MEIVWIFRAEEQLLNFELPFKMTSMISDKSYIPASGTLMPLNVRFYIDINLLVSSCRNINELLHSFRFMK